MDIRLPHFAEDRASLDSFFQRLPLLPCAHCGSCGNLIGHGLLRGYAEADCTRLIRGRRFFCSNRGRKRGCGRTVSVLLAHFVARFVATAATLWTLFSGLAEGLSVERAVAQDVWPLSGRSAYRLAVALRRASFRWRSLLMDWSPAPFSQSPEPLKQLKEHLLLHFSSDPFERLQLKTDTDLL